MMHRRFFIEPRYITKENVELRDKDDIHHIRVLRLKEGDKIIILDGSGKEYSVIIASISCNVIKGEIVETRTKEPSQIELTLVQGLPKSNKMDLIISKCTELGVARIIPVRTRRSVILNDERLLRWERIAKSSSSQCQRLEIPTINPIVDIETSLELTKGIDVGLIFYENAIKPLREVLKGLFKFKKIAIFIGPEGGFTHQEVIQIEAKGFIPVSLGRYLFRCETAPIVAVSILLYELGGIG